MSSSKLANPVNRRGRSRLKPAGVVAVIISVPLYFPLLLAVSDDAWSQQNEQQIQIKSGRAKAQGCTRCHGRNGIQALAEKTGWTDSISSFVTRRLTDLREGVSHHAVMTDIAAVLSDEDIRDISAWIQSLSDKSK